MEKLSKLLKKKIKNIENNCVCLLVKNSTSYSRIMIACYLPQSKDFCRRHLVPPDRLRTGVILRPLAHQVSPHTAGHNQFNCN